MTLLDGGAGTMLQAAGLAAGTDPCEWNLGNPAAVTALHRAYLDAGSEIVLANTFGANPLKYRGRSPLGEVVAAALRLAREAGERPHRVALDIGPTGRLLAPSGDLAFEAAYRAFAETVKLAMSAPCAPDLVFIETMGDTREIKAAVLAAKENSPLPIFATAALGEDGKLLTGADVETYAALMESLGVDAYGFNCGFGPDRMLEFVERLAKVSTKPIIVKPNAGMPHVVDGRTVFEVGPERFAREMSALVSAGATVIGGCCGTTPAHIAAIAALTAACAQRPSAPPPRISSGSRLVDFTGASGLVIGERINPTGKKKLQAAYRDGDTAYILREAIAQVEAGAAVLDVNAGVPGIDEVKVLGDTVEAVQSVTDTPLEIDTSDPVALERALRLYNGCALVNSVNGAEASMRTVLPLVAKYGAMVVALTLDESGIPPSAEGRLAIARRILARGAECGIAADRFLFDALTMTVSTDDRAAAVTLETVRRLTAELGVKTVLGVSNVSFGLPDRVALNNAMFALAKRAGLTAAIANPMVIRDEIAEGAEDVLLGRDAGCAKWIARHQSVASAVPAPSAVTAAPSDPLERLVAAVRHGLRADANAAAAEMLRSVPPLEVIERGIVPALELVGAGFEKGTVYLPQLLMSAEAASAAFAAVRDSFASAAETASVAGAPIVLATVKGDIHDIGKNIVKALLENYGFAVVDLGRDVPPERIVAAALEHHAKLVGLSALMTTTTGAMAETIRQLKSAAPEVLTMVGGAVITADYATQIGATYYAKDAMASVRIAKECLK